MMCTFKFNITNEHTAERKLKLSAVLYIYSLLETILTLRSIDAHGFNALTQVHNHLGVIIIEQTN